MRLNGMNGFAILLIGCGALILLDKVGFGLGSLIGYLIPLALITLGYIGVKRGNSFFGWVFCVIGGILLLGKLSGFIGLVIAIALIGYGVSLLKKRPKIY